MSTVRIDVPDSLDAFVYVAFLSLATRSPALTLRHAYCHTTLVSPTLVPRGSALTHSPAYSTYVLIVSQCSVANLLLSILPHYRSHYVPFSPLSRGSCSIGILLVTASSLPQRLRPHYLPTLSPILYPALSLPRLPSSLAHSRVFPDCFHILCPLSPPYAHPSTRSVAIGSPPRRLTFDERHEIDTFSLHSLRHSSPLAPPALIRTCSTPALECDVHYSVAQLICPHVAPNYDSRLNLRCQTDLLAPLLPRVTGHYSSPSLPTSGHHCSHPSLSRPLTLHPVSPANSHRPYLSPNSFSYSLPPTLSLFSSAPLSPISLRTRSPPHLSGPLKYVHLFSPHICTPTASTGLHARHISPGQLSAPRSYVPRLSVPILSPFSPLFSPQLSHPLSPPLRSSLILSAAILYRSPYVMPSLAIFASPPTLSPILLPTLSAIFAHSRFPISPSLS
ncbi:hypothetical protein C7M84_019984 [Penaeus vannamei]|uniref:Uncharacterized protein n=1 Tax=Penaeus vannamei TaxID=6689 RepID=A0A3R7PDE0_PENVA|nr:hypothetical protein C7M84_019984 [Penaeus vannamei]